MIMYMPIVSTDGLLTSGTEAYGSEVMASHALNKMIEQKKETGIYEEVTGLLTIVVLERVVGSQR